jgi:hypothetical protein
MIGEDWNLNIEYCNALLRAAILEGEVYILIIDKGEKREIASWTVWFPPGRTLFGTQVFSTFVNSFSRLTKFLGSEAQRALGFNDFFQKMKPEGRDWLTNIVCISIRSRWRLPLSGDLYVSIQDMSRKLRMSYLPKRSVSL